MDSECPLHSMASARRSESILQGGSHPGVFVREANRERIVAQALPQRGVS
jgi:hypothetical protein